MPSVALLAPAVVGWNVTVALVDAPAANVAVAGAPTENWSAFVPVSVSGVVSVTLEPLTLLIVNVLNAVPPTATLPKS